MYIDLMEDYLEVLCVKFPYFVLTRLETQYPLNILLFSSCQLGKLERMDGSPPPKQVQKSPLLDLVMLLCIKNFEIR